MIKVSIIKNNVVTNAAQFISEELANIWFMQEAANGSFGKNERWLSESEFSDENVESALESREREGMKGVMEYKFPAVYTVQMMDVSVQAQAQAESMAAVKYLMDTDWYVIRELDSGEPCPANVKTARAAARLKVIR